VKVRGNLNRWLNTEAIQELLGWSPESIDLLIKGLSTSILKSSDGSRIVINLNDLKEHLIAVKKLADSFLGAPSPKKIKDKIPKPKKVKDKIPKPEKAKNNIEWLTGKKAAEKLNCSYKIVLELIKKHGLPAKIRGKGWQINPNELEEFLKANQELIRSFLESETVRNVETKIVPSSGDSEKLQDITDVPKEGDETDKIDQDQSQTSTALSVIVPSTAVLEVAVPQNTESEKDSNQDTGSTESSDEPENDSTSSENDEQSKPTDKKTSQNNEPIDHYISIKLTKYGCRIDDVAMALPNISITTVMKWIEEHKVETINGPGPRGIEQYIKPESLRAFLLKQRNTAVTFNEIKGAIIMQRPDSKNPMPAR